MQLTIIKVMEPPWPVRQLEFIKTDRDGLVDRHEGYRQSTWIKWPFSARRKNAEHYGMVLIVSLMAYERTPAQNIKSSWKSAAS